MNDMRRQLDHLLDIALDLPAGELADFLENRCPPHMRKRLEALLETSEETTFIDLDPLSGSLGRELARPCDASAELVEGDRLGNWRVLEKIGEGGMGYVYLVEHTVGPRQRAALKIARGSTERIVKRFRLEKEILASLDQPDAVSFLEGGQTADGRPYLVMELVRGEHLDVYSDRRCLSIEGRLRLFLGVCRAVEGVHRQGLVHRDLKPANVLADSEGRTTLLDFGIAKRVDSTVRGSETAVEAMTPNYASPEQFLGRPITPATDVYQLGVLLYLLATGELPHRLEGRGPARARRAVCEETPWNPSEVFASPTAPWDSDLRQRARQRSESVQGLCRTLSGELDRIVLKALAKDPEDRYTSVRDLIAAIETYLESSHPLALAA